MTEKINKYYQEELTEAEQKALLREAYADPLLKKQMIDYQNIQSLTQLSADAMNADLGASRYAFFMAHIKKLARQRIFFSVMRYAAFAALLIASTWMVTTHEASHSITQQELYVPAGQRARLTLPDGSKVWLNAGSTLSYPSVFGKERRVHLSGEGFFDVAKNAKSPFIVSTSTIDIKALGTQFNVFSYPKSDYMSVYLKEGSIKAYYAASEKKGVTLSPNQRLTRQGGEFLLETIPSDPLLWRDGIYTFNKQKLGDMVKLLELYYDVNIEVKDTNILNYEYTGKFRQRDGVMEILRVIQHIHPFQIIKNEELNQIALIK
ncbi:MAG: FecR domain-containing protein [Tannerellaceae bacterium]